MHTFNYIDRETGEPIETVYERPDLSSYIKEEIKEGVKVMTLESNAIMTPHKFVTFLGGHVDTYYLRDPETGRMERWI